MSLESVISDLARAIDTNQPNAAVREIIRQRDAALEQAAKNKNTADYYERRTDTLWRELQTERRRGAALRGCITRLKNRSASIQREAQ